MVGESTTGIVKGTKSFDIGDDMGAVEFILHPENLPEIDGGRRHGGGIVGHLQGGNVFLGTQLVARYGEAA